MNGQFGALPRGWVNGKPFRPFFVHAGEVRQIISGSIGLDDWEWGVDLFAEDPAIFKRLIWGGRRLATVLRKPIGEGSEYAESWEISPDLVPLGATVEPEGKAQGATRVILEGKSLRDGRSWRYRFEIGDEG